MRLLPAVLLALALLPAPGRAAPLALSGEVLAVHPRAVTPEGGAPPFLAVTALTLRVETPEDGDLAPSLRQLGEGDAVRLELASIYGAGQVLERMRGPYGEGMDRRVRLEGVLRLRRRRLGGPPEVLLEVARLDWRPEVPVAD